MDQKEELENERLAIANELASIHHMRRGTVNEQFFEVRHKDGTITTRGPYHLYSRTEKGKSYSRRIPLEEVARYREETESCRRFKELSNRYVLVCEQLADAGAGQEKKRSKSKRSASAK
jgi:hypothetical protein